MTVLCTAAECQHGSEMESAIGWEVAGLLDGYEAAVLWRRTMASSSPFARSSRDIANVMQRLQVDFSAISAGGRVAGAAVLSLTVFAETGTTTARDAVTSRAAVGSHRVLGQSCHDNPDMGRDKEDVKLRRPRCEPRLPMCRRTTAVNLVTGFFQYLRDEQEAVQKRTFTKWINSHLAKDGGQLELNTDMDTGQTLLMLCLPPSSSVLYEFFIAMVTEEPSFRGQLVHVDLKSKVH
ncbi:hypothetical protein Z043_103031 [Scleropages formosus]|uniref:Calponin-homology (CH) domain-containing protein n=1 Tax=Scleropages formosus TaxID=113540 RepID=A0A0P7UT02_SCLFO|nr:hypothetical protein Z043_103031 [Scleropages formosus]